MQYKGKGAKEQKFKATNQHIFNNLWYFFYTSQVSPASRSDVTVCMCNHLTVFAVVVVPVNTINFNYVFTQSLSENKLVFNFVVVMLSIYLLAVAIMRRYDRDDVLKVKISDY